MKWIGGLITLAIVCFGLFYRYDQYQSNKRTERLNDRIAVINIMTEVSNKAVSNYEDCQKFFVQWYQETLAGNDSKAQTGKFFSERCGERARSYLTEAETEAKRAKDRAPDSDFKDAYIQSSLSYVAAFRTKGSHFDDIYAMMQTATDRGESFGPLADEINALLDRDIGRIDVTYQAFDAAESAYYNDFD